MTDAVTDHAPAPAPEGADHHGPTDLTFVKTAAVLAVLTAFEVWLSYSGLSASIFVPLLLVVMVIKFFVVVLVFMHVKYDAKIFGRLFYMGLGLDVAVYIGTLLAFHFFT